MSVTTEEIKALITGDPSGFIAAMQQVQGELDKTEKVSLRSTKAYNDGAAEAEVATANLTKSVAILGGVLATAFAIKRIADVGAALVALGSDAEQALRLVNQGLGDSADVVTNWAEANATAYGMTRAEAEKAAGGIGSLLTGFGLAEPLAAKMAVSMVALAGDIASFNNIDPSVALEKLKGGLTGTGEGLKDIGLRFSEAEVKQKAFELGLVTQGEQLDSATKAQAAFVLMLEGSTRQQEDAARNADNLAQMIRVMRAESEDAADSFGKMLLPAATDAAHAFSEVLPGAIAVSTSALGWLLGTTEEYASKSTMALNDGWTTTLSNQDQFNRLMSEADTALMVNMLNNRGEFHGAQVAGDNEAMRVMIANQALGIAAIESITNEHFTTSLINAALYQETLSNYIFRRGWENIVNSVGESWTNASNIVSKGYAAVIEGGANMVQSAVKIVGAMFPELLAKLKEFYGMLPSPIQALIGTFGTYVKGAIDQVTAPFRVALTAALTAADLLRKGAGAVWDAFSLAGEAFNATKAVAFDTSGGAGKSFTPDDFDFEPGGFTPPKAPKQPPKPKKPKTPRDSSSKSKEEEAALLAARMAEAVSGAIESGLEALRSLAKEPLPPEEQWRARLDALTVFLDASNQAFEGLLVDQFARFGVKLKEGGKAFVKGPMSALEPFADAVEASASALQAAAEAGGSINESEEILLGKLATAEQNASRMVDSLYRLSANFRAADQTSRDELVGAVGDFDTYLTTAASVLGTAASADLRGATALQARNVATAEANGKLLQDSLYRMSVNFRAASEVAREVLLGASQDYVTFLGLSRQALETAAGIDLSKEITVTRQRADAAATAATLLVNATYAAAHNFIVAATDDRRGLAALLVGVQAWHDMTAAGADALKTSATIELPRQAASSVAQMRAAAAAADALVDVTWDTAQNFIIAATDDQRGLAALNTGVAAWSQMLQDAASGLQATVDTSKAAETYTALNVENMRQMVADSLTLLAEVQIGSVSWRSLDEKMRTELVHSLQQFADAQGSAADVITGMADVLKVADVPNVLRREVVDTWHVLAAYAVLLLGEVERATAEWRKAADKVRGETVDSLGDFANAEGSAAEVISSMADVLKLPTIENVLRADVLQSWKVLADYAPLLLAEVTRASALWRESADTVRNETVEGLKDFADAEGSAASVISSMSDALALPVIENVIRADVLQSWKVLADYAPLLLLEVERASAEWRRTADLVRDETVGGLKDFSDATGAAGSVVKDMADVLGLDRIENILRRDVLDSWHVVAAYAVLLVAEVSAASSEWRKAAQDVRTEAVASLQDFADAESAAASVIKDMADVLGVANVENVLRRSVLDTWHILAAYGSLMAQEVQKVADLAPEFDQKGLDAFAAAVGASSSALKDAAEALDAGSKVRVADPAAVVSRMKEAAKLFLDAGKELADTVRADDAQIRASVAESAGKIAAGFGDMLGLIGDAIESPFGKIKATGQRGDTFKENLRRRIVSSLQLAASALAEASASLSSVPGVDASVLENVNSIAAAYSAIMGLVTDAQKALATGGSLDAVRRLSQVPFILAEGLAIGGNLAGTADARPQNGGLAVNVNLSPTFLPINITTNVATTVQVGPVEMGRFFDVYEEYRQERLEGESGR